MIYAIHTDKGIVKKVNQDSALVKKASTDGGEILFSVVCDGMGGAVDGELASAEVVEAMQEWFSADLPFIISEGLSAGKLKKSLNDKIIAEDEAISEYCVRRKYDCGTTLTGIFLCAGRFLCVNVGDSRVYRIRGGKAELLTHDHTVVQDMLDSGEIKEEDLGFLAYSKAAVQQMIDSGKLTEAQAHAYTMRSVLSQCIGVEGDVNPEYTEGTYAKDDIFLLCSDGFRHKLTAQEIADAFPIGEMRNEKRIKRCAVRAVEENIRRGERDNITVVVIRT